MVQHHWWNGNPTPRGRRDVYICTDGLRWEVRVQIGGISGPSKVQECPSRGSAAILANAWKGSSPAWRELQL